MGRTNSPSYGEMWFNIGSIFTPLNLRSFVCLTFGLIPKTSSIMCCR
jgi:hypothetical protein